MYKKITDKEKLEFLEQLLITDNEFKIKFENYFNIEQKAKRVYNDTQLNDVVEEIFKVFNGVDLELYMPECNCGHSGYYDYYEEDISQELCEGLFVEIEKEINDFLRKKDFFQALFLLVATDKAIGLSPDVDDEYGLIYDYEEILYDYHSSLVYKFIDSLGNLSFEDKKRFVLFLVDNSDDTFQLRKYEQLFITLINDKEIALFASNHISSFHINIQLKILDLLQNDKSYIDTAKQFYKDDRNIAKKLLDRLDKIGNYKEYEFIAKECFAKNNDFASDIFKVITYDKSKEFYLEILRHKVLHHQNIDEYILYKTYIDEKELKKIQDKLCGGWSYNYCIKVLVYEKKYDKILQIAQKSKNIDYSMVLKPIKYHYPKECFEIIINKCNELMGSFGRGRSTYHEICNLLNIISKIPMIKDDVKIYIKNNLTNRKPKLPALLDELQKAKLL